MRPILPAAIAATLALAFPAAFPLEAAPEDPVSTAIQDLVDDGHVVAAQVVVGDGEGTGFSAAFGTLGPGNSRPADAKTLFLVGSVSKPFAAACVLSLVEDPGIDISLDDPVDRWLPAFGHAKLASGKAAERAPTVNELLCHRGGIYSQKREMTRRQTSLIRDFRRDLETAVDGIAAEPLIAEPGERYFYSGAGYCVLGRIAEVAAGKPFEHLLRTRLCEPLGLERTTYFPGRENENIAAGFGPKAYPHALGKGHQFPLIGGSLYSTAEEMATFARAILASRDGEDETALLKPASFHAMASPPFPGQSYGLGWGLGSHGPGNAAHTLSHSGALLSARAFLRIDLESEAFAAAVWTLGSKESDSITKQAIRRAFDAIFASGK